MARCIFSHVVISCTIFTRIEFVTPEVLHLPVSSNFLASKRSPKCRNQFIESLNLPFISFTFLIWWVQCTSQRAVKNEYSKFNFGRAFLHIFEVIQCNGALWLLKIVLIFKVINIKYCWTDAIDALFYFMALNKD